MVCFAEQCGLDAEGEKTKNYYVQESVGIAFGLFITAAHYMGLATLSHPPALPKEVPISREEVATVLIVKRTWSADPDSKVFGF